MGNCFFIINSPVIKKTEKKSASAPFVRGKRMKKAFEENVL